MDTCIASECDEHAHLEVYRDGAPQGRFCSWRCLCRFSMDIWVEVEGL